MSNDAPALSWKSPPPADSRVGITLETYILEGMMGFPAATGAFTSLLNQIGLAAKLITSIAPARSPVSALIWARTALAEPTLR